MRNNCALIDQIRISRQAASPSVETKSFGEGLVPRVIVKLSDCYDNSIYLECFHIMTGRVGHETNTYDY